MVAGTDPTNGLSVFRLKEVVLEDGGLALQWFGGTGRTQYVDRADVLSDGVWIGDLHQPAADSGDQPPSPVPAGRRILPMRADPP
jgi:hypothetical protein